MLQGRRRRGSVNVAEHVELNIDKVQYVDGLKLAMEYRISRVSK